MNHTVLLHGDIHSHAGLGFSQSYQLWDFYVLGP